MKNRRTIVAVGLVWGSFAALGLANAAGLHVNLTVSMPRGIWQERPLSGAMKAGDIAVVCLAPTDQTRRYIGPGSCANGLEPLLKTVGAVAGDMVTLGPSGVTVNGHPLPRSATLAADAAGRTLTAYPPGTYRVKRDEVYLFSSHDVRSYDSRYWGPIETTAIVTMARPVWTVD